MGKNANFVSHKKSKLKENGGPKLPLAADLVEGEIAINFGKDVETLSIKNESGDVVTFSSDNYYSDKKLGSGFTGENSGVTVTDVIIENEEIVSAALTDLDERKLDATAYTPTDLSNYYKKSETSGATEISNALNEKISTSDIDQVIDSGTSASTDAVSTSAVYGFVTSYTPSITVDQVLDDTTSASTNPVSSKAVYKAVTDNELAWTNAYVALSGTVSAHTSDTTIHITSAERTAWNAKADISDIPSVNGYADSVKYNSTSHYVEFYHGTTAGTKVFEYDASPFIIDGMVQNVEIKDVQSGDPAVTVTCLVVSFNTDAGKQDINIPISQIFDANNYYTKSETSGATEISNALSNYYTKSETSGATEISNALGTKVNSATFTGHTADTTIHFTTGTVQTQIDNSISGKVNTSDIVSAITPSNSGSTNPIATKVVAENELTVSAALTDLDERKLDASAYTPTDLSNYYTKSETSGATELSNAFAEKSGSGHTHEASGVTAMTGYQIASSAASILTTDTLLEVIGKLEKRIVLLEDSMQVQSNGDIHAEAGEY